MLFQSLLAFCVAECFLLGKTVSAISGFLSGHPRNTRECQLKFAIPDFQHSVCKGSSFFIDFGSSGMKVYRAHKLSNRSSVFLDSAGVGVLGKTTDVNVIKIRSVSADSEPCEITAALNALAKKIDMDSSGKWALLATASMRLKPKRARVVLEAVRTWNDNNHGVLGRCGGQTENEDCGMLSGSVEASLEMRAMVASNEALEFLEGGQRRDSRLASYGFASCGGGSLQVGFRGPKEQLLQCKKDLGNFNGDLDPQRVAVLDVASEPALLVSFLGSHTLDGRPCERGPNGTLVCDYVVGGINEMRANFDNFLSSRGHSENPCLSPYTQPWHNDNCKFYDVPTTRCVIDKFGGTVSRLPPVGFHLSGADRVKHCQKLVREFLATDLMLSRWATSSACTRLGKFTFRMGLMSAFTRLTGILPLPGQPIPGQSLSDTPNEVGDNRNISAEFSVVRELSADHARFASQEEASRHDAVGTFLDLTLLVRFLKVVGISDSTLVRGIPVEWADVAMFDRHLVPGWLSFNPDS